MVRLCFRWGKGSRLLPALCHLACLFKRHLPLEGDSRIILAVLFIRCLAFPLRIGQDRRIPDRIRADHTAHADHGGYRNLGNADRRRAEHRGDAHAAGHEQAPVPECPQGPGGERIPAVPRFVAVSPTGHGSHRWHSRGIKSSGFSFSLGDETPTRGVAADDDRPHHCLTIVYDRPPFRQFPQPANTVLAQVGVEAIEIAAGDDDLYPARQSTEGQRDGAFPIVIPVPAERSECLLFQAVIPQRRPAPGREDEHEHGRLEAMP